MKKAQMNVLPIWISTISIKNQSGWKCLQSVRVGEETLLISCSEVDPLDGCERCNRLSMCASLAEQRNVTDVNVDPHLISLIRSE